MTILAESAPEMALLDVDTAAEITPFIISCLALTLTSTLFAAVIEISLSPVALSPMMAFLSVKNKFKANEPPTELDPPEPDTEIAKF